MPAAYERIEARTGVAQGRIAKENTKPVSGAPNVPVRIGRQLPAVGMLILMNDAAQEKAREFAGQKVAVIGELDAKTKTIHLMKIEAAK